MKRLGRIFLLGLFVTLVLTACAPTLAQFVQLNSELQVLIEAAIVLLVGWVFVQLTNLWPWFGQFFGKYQEEVAIALAGAVVGVVQNLLNLIPPEWEEVGVIAQVLLVAILVAIGLFRALGKAGVKGIRPV